MATLALIDGHSITYRAFYALPKDLATSSGQVTNAVFGFTRMLIRLLADENPEALAVAWDVSRETFRTDLFPSYKAQRSRTPDLLAPQFSLLQDLLEALEVPQIRQEGFEADDVIASLADRATAGGWQVLAVTGDRDVFQLVDEQFQVLYTRRGVSDTVKVTPKWVEKRYSVPPSRYVEIAALRGDNSDNLPGVPGVGEKTAARLIKEYGAVEEVFENLGDLTPRLRANLAENRQQVLLNKELITLRRDLELDVEMPDLVRRAWDVERVRELVTSLEFFSLWNDLQGVQVGGVEPEIGRPEVEIRVLNSAEAVQSLGKLDHLVLEMVRDEHFLGVAVREGENQVALVPEDLLGGLRAMLADPRLPKTTHDAKPLIRWLGARGLKLEGLQFDTALAAYVVNPATGRYQLEELAERMIGLSLSEDLPEGERPAQASLVFDPGPRFEQIGVRVEAIARLVEPLRSELDEREESELFAHVELPLVAVLAEMEDCGIGVDREYLLELSRQLRSDITGLEERIFELAGGKFNVNSTLQLREVLFGKLGLPVIKKTATGKPSTDASVLGKLKHPMVDLLLEFRQLEKIRSSHVDGYISLIEADGRIHTRFNQMGTSTGRVSSENPNLQTIPIRTEVGRTVRRAFVAGPQRLLLVADYSQIELRVLSHMSQDAGLVEAFWADVDIHTATAARVFEVDLAEVTADMRRRAKTINFGLLYGMEAFGLSQRLDISREEAAEHIEAYFSQFPGVKSFMDGMVLEARRLGYTTTLFKRRRYLPELRSDNFRIRQMGERMALNAPVQGTAADIIKKAMISLAPQLLEVSPDCRLLLQIHDELVIEAPEEDLADVAALTVEVMEGITELVVPLKVEVASGRNLAECKG
ncbi:MAG: DNA polymerase I [bacterium]|nr:DNA polymerase I [Acidimicrobiia bacterium]MCY4651146.1 DNA polymerase I [bacterium]